MKILLLSFILLPQLLWALSVGERARTVRDSALQRGTEKILTVPKGTEFDVQGIDKSGNWVGTELKDGAESFAGWLLRKDVQTIPGACAAGYDYRCSPKEEMICKSTCAPVCRIKRVWVCNGQPSYPGVGSPPYWPKPPGGSQCGYVNMKICQNECTVDCKPQMKESCGCVR